MLNKKTLLLNTAIATSLMLPVGTSFAQSSDEGVEEIIVTGSLIRRPNQSEQASPIAVVGSEDFNNIGAKNVADMVQTLTFNSGSENNADAFTQNATTGTSNFNLRGLGVASTLVLLNGRRQVVSAASTNKGLNFVDTSSLVPTIAIDRIEIVKDGAAATYGSDAVAGVVNFITNDRFEGFKASADHQFNMSQGSQSDTLIQGMVGMNSERAHFIAAVSYYDRTSLTTEEKRFSRVEDDSSSIGSPGAYFTQFLPANPALGLPGNVINLGRPLPIIDPTGCESAGGNPLALGAPINTGVGVTFTPGLCRYDFGDHYVHVPEERRIQAYSKLSYEVSDDTDFTLEFSMADNDVERRNSPTFPYLRLPIVPDYHPDNPFGIPVAYFGRAMGNGFEPGERGNNYFTSNTIRFAAGLDTELSDTWYASVNAVHAFNDYTIRTPDTVVDRFQDAILGFGGLNCNQIPGQPGQNGCEFFNPFASGVPGGTNANSPELLDWLVQDQFQDIHSELTSIDAVVSGQLGDLGAGPISVAFGFHTRNEKYSNDYDIISNQDGFGFLQGNADYGDSRDATAIFAELLMPISDKLEATYAARYETYSDNLGSTFDPKVALRYQMRDNMSLRGSISTSYRAASIFQAYGGSTSLNQVLDPVNSTQVFAAIRSKLPENGARDLKPETSVAYNLGMSWQPGNFDINIDYYIYDFQDVITLLNYQSVVNADPQNTDNVIRAGDPLNGPIVMVLTDFVNASQIKTSGFDIDVAYNYEVGGGLIRPSFQATYTTQYDITDPIDGKFDGLGSRNFTTLGNPMPKMRYNVGLNAVYDTLSFNAYVRHIGEVEDDQNPGREIDSMTTVDFQATWNVSSIFDLDQGLGLTVGMINALNKNPPQVYTNAGYESKIHDPRGSMAYVKLLVDF